MRTRTTVILAGLGAVVLALGILYGGGPGERTDQSLQGAHVFPDLAARLGTAAKLDIQHGSVTLHLARDPRQSGALWTVAGRDHYRALQDKVRELLADLTGLRLDEPRTSDPAFYRRLGVANAGKGSDATLVRVLDGKGGVIAALIVGHARTAQSGNADTLYIRRPGEARSWLADGRLAATSDAQDWLDRSIVNIDAKQVAGVVVTRGGTTLKFARQGGTFTLTEPATHPKLDAFKLDEVSRALSDLTLEDVKHAPPPGQPLGRAVFTTTDGRTVTAEVNKDGPAIWATFAATGKGTDALEDKVKGWAYEIGSWKESSLVPTMDDLKAATPAPPATPAAPAPVPAK